jgi:hypothetical protein
VERRKNLHGGRNVRFACGIENVRVYWNADSFHRCGPTNREMIMRLGENLTDVDLEFDYIK